MKLYYVVGSPNSRKVHAVVNHLGLSVEFEYLDFFTGDLQASAFLAVNPNGMVPTLVDGDLELWESNAIMQYLADRPGGEQVYPRDPRLRADVHRWQCWELAHFNQALGTIAFEAVAKPGFGIGSPNQPLVAEATANLGRFAPVLERHLHGRKYLLGDRFTIADYSMVHIEAFKDAIPFDWSPFPQVNAYFNRMRDVEHWARTAPPSREAIGRKPGAARSRGA
jgi:glutathione S-transferase